MFLDWIGVSAVRICGTESNEEVRKELGKRIRDMRLKMDIRQKEISKRTGISAETIRRIEKGENVKVDHLLDVLRELELLRNTWFFPSSVSIKVHMSNGIF